MLNPPVARGTALNFVPCLPSNAGQKSGVTAFSAWTRKVERVLKHMHRAFTFLVCTVRALVATCVVFPMVAAERRGGGNFFQEDFPFQGACIGAKFPAKNVAMKGFAIRVGNDANVLWDTDLLRMAAGWTGGYISGNGVVYNGSHGQHPAIVGEQRFGTPPLPGWADAKGEFKDNRPEPFGPLSKDWCRLGWNVCERDERDARLYSSRHEDLRAAFKRQC
jgi:hypothetical protein